MRVLPARGASSLKKQVLVERRPPAAQTATIQAPTRGLSLNENRAAAQPGGALRLDNWWPTLTGIRVRGGTSTHATLSTQSPVQSMFTYVDGPIKRFFAATENSIFDISAPSNPTTPITPAVTGQTSGNYSTVQIGTPGGQFLIAVNGTDDALLFDGSTWQPLNDTSTPAITGVATSDISFVWKFSNRLFMAQKDTGSAWFLPVQSIAGEALEFSLDGVFQDGGAIDFGGTWSVDSGEGLDDNCVFVSETGSLAVYQGTNPASASEFQLVGSYQITEPLGKNATMRAGGDLLIATTEGIVPLSEAQQKDPAALSLSAVTRNIQPLWEFKSRNRTSKPWSIARWGEQNLMLVLTQSSTGPQVIAANLETGAWGFVTGWDAESIQVFGTDAFYGSTDGVIYRMESGGSDNGVPYTASYVGVPDHLGAVGVTKTILSARAVFLAGAEFEFRLSASVDYREELPDPPQITLDTPAVGARWGEAIWGESLWPSGGIGDGVSRWVSVGLQGFAVSPQIQITIGDDQAPNISLVAFDLLYESGGVMV